MLIKSVIPASKTTLSYDAFSSLRYFIAILIFHGHAIIDILVLHCPPAAPPSSGGGGGASMPADPPGSLRACSAQNRHFRERAGLRSMLDYDFKIERDSKSHSRVFS